MDSKKRSVHLPEEIIEEILPRLPVKSLLRFRCVSKSWRYLIGSDGFIKTHLQKSTQNASFSQHRVIFRSNSGLIHTNPLIEQCTLQSLLNNGPSIDLTPVYDPTNSHFKGCTVIGCCNGLLSILKHAGNIFILNPATRVYAELDKVRYTIENIGFGWDEQSGAHKVFVVVHTRIGKVYSTKTNSWKTVANGLTVSCPLIGKFARGKLYWYNSFESYIESFDLATEEFGRIKPPFHPRVGVYAWLGDIGGCLCIVFGNPLQVWVLKDSWSKLATIPLPRDHWAKFNCLSNHSFGEGPNGEIFLIFGNTLLVYNPKDNVLSAPRNIEGFTMYVCSIAGLRGKLSLTTSC